MIEIDGSYGEGGGQIIRSSLALSLMTGKPFRIYNIRSGRKKPGIMRQHLAAIKAAQQVGAAEVEGLELHSKEIVFKPHDLNPCDYKFSIGTAGSTTLVLQTILPVLLTASKPSTIELHGGTHNPFAPPFDFLKETYVPLINKMGPKVTVELDSYGFYPAGGGILKVEIVPVSKLNPINITKRKNECEVSARALVAKLPMDIGEREVQIVREKLSISDEKTAIINIEKSCGHGNVILLEVKSEQLTEVFTGFGEFGKSAERVATKMVQEVKRYLRTEASVGKYLADQLLLPMVFAGSGSFVTTSLSRHSQTNISVIKRFIDASIETEEVEKDHVVVSIGEL